METFACFSCLDTLFFLNWRGDLSCYQCGSQNLFKLTFPDKFNENTVNLYSLLRELDYFENYRGEVLLLLAACEYARKITLIIKNMNEHALRTISTFGDMVEKEIFGEKTYYVTIKPKKFFSFLETGGVIEARKENFRKATNILLKHNIHIPPKVKRALFVEFL